MTDCYVKVKVQLEQMKSIGDDGVKEGVEDTEEQVPVSSPPASVSPDSSGVTIPGTDSSNTSGAGKQGAHRGRGRSKPSKDDKNSCGKRISDLPSHGTVVAAHVGKNLNRLGHDRTLHIRGTGRILQGKSETNGNYVTNHASKNIQDPRGEDPFKLGRKRRPVTVDTSKAKTSLEALKLSIKQLKWKEVCCVSVCVMIQDSV